jgi:hypothetical protein
MRGPAVNFLEKIEIGTASADAIVVDEVIGGVVSHRNARRQAAGVHVQWNARHEQAVPLCVDHPVGQHSCASEPSGDCRVKRAEAERRGGRLSGDHAIGPSDRGARAFDDAAPI